ncbi:MAG: flavodoxin family protein, partial [Peptostreptococcaceae bacterium]
IYFDSVSAKVKTVVDRTQAFYASKYVLKKPSIDRSKKRLGMYISVGGASSYDTQFKGGQIVMDFFFKSINTKLVHNLYLNQTDEVTSEDNLEFRQNLDENLDEYIKGLVTE